MQKLLVNIVLLVLISTSGAMASDWSTARTWNEQLLDAIRNDTARPTVHARNLYHLSVAIYDAWAAYETTPAQVMHQERASAGDLNAARNETISYAAYQVLRHRFVNGPGGAGPGRLTTLIELENQMTDLGYDPFFSQADGNSPAALGNRIAQSVVQYGLQDGSNEALNYADPTGYAPLNEPMSFDDPGTALVDPNRWQPLKFERERRDQFGSVITQQVQKFLGPHWGDVKPFALTASDRSDAGVYVDQGMPPQLAGVGDNDFRAAVREVIHYSSLLDGNSTELIDISPGTRGNSPLGSYVQVGHEVNPYTGLPYAPQWVNRGDWGRVVAEFWADGPESEAPPGHWNVIGNDVSDRMDELGIPKRLAGAENAVVDNLEWDVKMYLALNGAIHDAAVAAWDHKQNYDYSRPVSMIRYMGQLGQSTDPDLTVVVGGQTVSTYHPDGLALEDGLIEVITPESTTAGGRHEHLAGHEGEVAIYCWRGPPQQPIESPDSVSGVGWILAEEWLPYQRDDFVTPPFAGYVSGHSTFSRAGAEVLAQLTGDEYFPGGVFEYRFETGEGLEFEFGPSHELALQWATYFDAADEAGLSRLYGGIHVPADDLPGRRIGSQIGIAAWQRADEIFRGVPEPASGLMFVLGWAIILRRRRASR